MLPIALDLRDLPVAVVGTGPLAERRVALLQAAGADCLEIYETVPENLDGIGLLLVAGLPEAEAEALAARARAAGILVNVEDVVPLCDFHVPAIVRRGELVVAVSTAGKSPALARLMKRRLEAWLDPAWDGWIEALAERRSAWRAEGLSPAEIMARTEALLEEKGWLGAP